MPTTLYPPLHGGGNLAGQDTGREHLSHTALSAFLACPRKYAFQYEHRLELSRRPSALSLGSAFQHSIEHNDSGAGARRLRAERRVLSQRDEDELQVDETVVRCASALYLAKWPRQGEAEFEYRVRLRNPATGALSRTFDLLGYADELLDCGEHYALVENKFVGQISAVSIRRLPLDRQIALECYGVWRATGRPVGEVFYRFTRKPSIKQRQKESVEDYCTRIEEDYATRPDFYAVEEHLYRGADDLLQVEEELWEWASQLRRQRGSTWTRNTTHCTDYGGCAFLPACLGEPGWNGLYRIRAASSRTS